MLTDGNEPEADAAAPEVQQEHQEQQQAQQHEVTVQQMPISLHKEIEVQIRVKNITRWAQLIMHLHLRIELDSSAQLVAAAVRSKMPMLSDTRKY